MRYSRTVKMSVLKKVLPPENKSIRSMSRESGICEQTIRNWIRESKDDKMMEQMDEKSPKFYTAKEKYHVLIESAGISEENLGQYLRERGLHSQHLEIWDQEMREMASKNKDKKAKEVRDLKKQNQELKKELARKDKALAETSAILVLKKKLDMIIEENEED